MIGRIGAILLQEFFLTQRSVEIVLDVFLQPIMSIIVFGFLSIYLAGVNIALAKNVLLGMLLWQVLSTTQFTFSTVCMWNLWSRNLTNLFITPLSPAEFFLASAMSAAIKSLVVFMVSSVILGSLFHFNVFSMGIITLVTTYLNLSIFAVSLGIAILGLIFRFGTKIQSFAWGALIFFQPITAALYPVEVLPPFLQKIAYLFPATYAFQSARFSIIHHQINWELILAGFVENAIYLFLCSWYFSVMFKKSKETGQFARNEG